MTLVNTGWLEENLNNIKILDASWHMPASKRNAEEEFSNEHIHGAQFFDLDKSSNENNPLPHMLPPKNKWQEIVSNYQVD